MIGGLVGVVFAVLVAVTASSAAAQIRLDPGFPDVAARGPRAAKGAVVWSHGRSVETEDSTAPTPLYVRHLAQNGWDVYRLDRMRASDTLSDSAQALFERAGQLKRRGYRQVVAAGQSFGAFISLIAAGQGEAIDAVIGTAPAAYGSFTDAYDSYRENADQLWPILRRAGRARVMLFFFHGDDFDPGGRGTMARAILADHGLEAQVIDQPAGLTGHGAANTGLFVRRFAACIARFAEGASKPNDPPCDERWGGAPSPSLMRATTVPESPSVNAPSGEAPSSEAPSGEPPPPVSGPASSGGAGEGDAAANPASGFLGTWYGAYVNGRELLLTLSRTAGGAMVADYRLGPGVAPGEGLEYARREGRLVDDALVFDEPGCGELRYRLRPDGRLAAGWRAPAGQGRLDTVLRRLDGLNRLDGFNRPG